MIASHGIYKKYSTREKILLLLTRDLPLLTLIVIVLLAAGAGLFLYQRVFETSTMAQANIRLKTNIIEEKIKVDELNDLAGKLDNKSLGQ